MSRHRRAASQDLGSPRVALRFLNVVSFQHFQPSSLSQGRPSARRVPGLRDRTTGGQCSNALLQILDIGLGGLLHTSALVSRLKLATVLHAVVLMRYLLGALAISALGAGLGACGGPSRGTASGGPATTAAVATSNFSTHNNDRDNDGDHNDDDEGVLHYGHAADAAVRRASVALVMRYFAAAAAEDGARACSLLAPFIAESVAEQNGHSPALRGATCPVVISKLFKLHHRRLALKNTTLRISEVRIEGDRGLVVLAFPTIPEVRQITERRIAGTWRLLDLFDGILE
jgi:hypothetical protein